MGSPSGPPTALDSLLVGGVPTMGMGGGIPVTFGNYWFVDYTNGSDGYAGNSMTAPFKTVAQAYSVMVDQNDDVCVIRGGSADNILASMLTISKSRCHFVGLDGAWRPYGQGAKITMNAATGATNVSAIKNIGHRNTFTNLKIINTSVVTQSIYTVQEAGEYAQYTNCEVYLPTNLGNTSAAEFVHNGDSTIIDNCTIGSLADALTSGATVRPCMLLTNGTVTGGYSPCVRDGLIRNTRFWRQSLATTNTFIYSTTADDVERTLTLEHVAFINSQLSAGVPAQAIKGGVSLTNGQIALDPTCFGVNVTKLSTTTGVIVTGPAPSSGTGIGVNAA